MKTASPAAPTKALLSYFDAKHKATVGHPAVIHGGKDGKLLSDLWKSHGEELVKALIADYFASPDPWIRKNGYSVSFFISQASKLLARRPRPVRPAEGEETWADECQRVHGRTCQGPSMHDQRMTMAARKVMP